MNFFQDYKLNGEKEPEVIIDESVTTVPKLQKHKTANLGGLGQAHEAPGNLEDLVSSIGNGAAPTTRVIDAV